MAKLESPHTSRNEKKKERKKKDKRKEGDKGERGRTVNQKEGTADGLSCPLRVNTAFSHFLLKVPLSGPFWILSPF